MMKELLIVATNIAIWAVQPFVMLHFVIGKSRLSIATVLVTLICMTGWLGLQLHECIRGRNVKPIIILLLWYPIAMQMIRYLHALSVGGTAFGRQFRLTSWRRVQIFTLSVPTVLFVHDDKPKTKTDDDKQTKDSSQPIMMMQMTYPKSTSSLSDELISCRNDLIGFLGTCALVLLFRLDVWLPLPLQQVIRVFIMAISTSLLKVVLEMPTRYLLRHSNDIHAIIPIYDQPHLASSPRDLWRRWSVTAGYHLKHGFYEPLLMRKESPSYGRRLVATMAPFAVNGVLHWTWWSIVVIGRLDDRYVYLLFLFPILTILVQDICVNGRLEGGEMKPTMSTSSLHKQQPQHKRHLNRIIVWTGAWCIGSMMSSVHGLSEDLGDVCRNNLLLQ